MSIVEQSVFDRRAERISSFVNEVRRYLYNECFDRKVTVSGIDCFCHEMFVCMNRTTTDYSFFELLHMLNSDNFMKEAYSRYYAAAVS